MLSLPDHYSEVGRIVGIDPGTNQLGFSVMEYDLRNNALLSIVALTFRSERMMDYDACLMETHHERAWKIQAQRRNLLRNLCGYRPHVVCCESPFYNRLRPGAYGPLVEMMDGIRGACMDYHPCVQFLTYEPSVVKRAVGAGAIAKKELVKEAILANTDLNQCYGQLASLDEHSLDAVAVAYSHLQFIRKNVYPC